MIKDVLDDEILEEDAEALCFGAGRSGANERRAHGGKRDVAG